jgi:hypothetical protein
MAVSWVSWMERSLRCSARVLDAGRWRQHPSLPLAGITAWLAGSWGRLARSCPLSSAGSSLPKTRLAKDARALEWGSRTNS